MDLDNEYPSCGNWDCVFVDCPLSKGPCLFCADWTNRKND